MFRARQTLKGFGQMLHVSNRAFLPNEHILRQRNALFPNKDEYKDPPPRKYNKAGEIHIRKQFEKLSDVQQKHLQKETGLKQPYSLMRQSEHDRVNQASPDGAHCMSDFLGTVLNHISNRITKKIWKIVHSWQKSTEVLTQIIRYKL